MGEVRTVAVIGAGSLGRGIAHVAVLGGYHTILEDILPGALRRAESEIRSQLEAAVGRGAVAGAQADAALARLEFAHSVEEAGRAAELVIEAVPDEMESKLEIFTLLDKICRPNTILASNTVSLSVSEIASITYRAPCCVGLRFLSPAHMVKRLEIVRGRETSDETVQTVLEVGRRMGKETVVVQEQESGVRSQ